MIPAEMPVFRHETVASLLSLGILPGELSDLRSMACENPAEAKRLEDMGPKAILDFLRGRKKESVSAKNPN